MREFMKNSWKMIKGENHSLKSPNYLTEEFHFSRFSQPWKVSSFFFLKFFKISLRAKNFPLFITSAVAVTSAAGAAGVGFPFPIFTNLYCEVRFKWKEFLCQKFYYDVELLYLRFIFSCETFLTICSDDFQCED